MKYYETTFEEYLRPLEKTNFHEELIPLYPTLSSNKDLIFYGPSGSGKYSQMLYYLHTQSPTKLHHYKKLTIQIEQSGNKTPYSIPMSDIHFEVDLAILGCNSKKVWHEIFFQLVEIIKMRENHRGIIVCKNFHAIHSELLEIFYSYLQHYRHREISIGANKVKISFILLTEHLSFIPNYILQLCQVIHVKSSSKDCIQKGLAIPLSHPLTGEARTGSQFHKRIQISKRWEKEKEKEKEKAKAAEENRRWDSIFEKMDETQVLNLKEYYSLSLMSLCNLNTKNQETYPKDIFNKVCSQIIEKIKNIPDTHTTDWFAQFRDDLYSILICQLDVAECVYYILEHFVISLPTPCPIKTIESVQRMMKKMYHFLLYYNNNYRPIYHLEIIFLHLIVEINGWKQ